MSEPRFELVLTCYNEARSLEAIVKRAVTAATENAFTPQEFQLVIVNNGSTDDSADVLRHLKSGEWGNWIRIVTVEVNQGYGYGLTSGLNTTTAEIIGWSHADEQCDPFDAFRAYPIVRHNPKVLVKGRRHGRSGKEKFVSFTFEILAKILVSPKLSEINAQPKVFPRVVWEASKTPPKDFKFDLYLLYSALKLGFKLYEIPVEFPPRVHGFSNWSATFFKRYKTIFGFVVYLFKIRFGQVDS